MESQMSAAVRRKQDEIVNNLDQTEVRVKLTSCSCK